MRFLFSLALSLLASFFLYNNLVFSEPVTVDLDAGEQVFSQNCVSCHAGGNNLVNPSKTLSLKDLHDNEKDSIQAIIKQVTNGANGMTAFGDRLSEEEITNVANYVLNQAQNSAW